MENVQLYYGVHLYACVDLFCAFLLYLCCSFDVCYLVDLVNICFSIVSTVFCYAMLLIALFFSLRVVILKSIAKIEYVILICMSDKLCTY